MGCCFIKKPKCNKEVCHGLNDKKDRVEFDLKTIIKSNTIKKANNLGNYNEQTIISKCNKKLSYLKIIEILQDEIDRIIKEIWDYNMNANVKEKEKDMKKIECYQKVIKYKIQLRNHYVNLIKDEISFKEKEEK
tara:strand:- start:1213 stop:1614 length:402 start_codon:yes stop_codon:yes gene_type:complete